MRSGVAKNAVTMADSSITLRRLAAQIEARRARAAGVDSELIDDALVQAAERSIAETRRTFQWALALNRSGPMPRGFRPDIAITDPQARLAALASLKERLDRKSSIQLERQRLYLDPDVAMEEIESFVEATLAQRLDQRSTGKFGKTIKVRQAFAVMGSLIDRLEGQGHRPFLVSGTLLGVVREGDLLEQDYDVDIGLLPGDGTVDEIATLVGSIDGFRVVVEEFRVLAEHDSGVGIDIFFHYERNGRMWHATDIHEWWNTPFELETVSVRGRDFWVPDNAERYLAENYGDWNKPIAFYHMSFDTPNREYRKNKYGLLYLYGIMLTAIESGDRFVTESAARELRDGFGIDVTDRLNDGPLLEPRT